MIEELEYIYKLTRATAEDKKLIAKLHQQVYGHSIHLCVECPASLRAGVNRLKKHYEQIK